MNQLGITEILILFVFVPLFLLIHNKEAVLMILINNEIHGNFERSHKET